MLKILSIGNSFSQDAQRYLTRFARAAGDEIMTGNLEIGGCSLEQHWNYFTGETKNYGWEVDGVWKAEGRVLTEGIMQDKWDIITIQQVSHLAGTPETFEPYLSNLVTAIRAMQPDAKLYFQETWEYEIGSAHGGFPEYGCDPDVMHTRVRNTCREAAKENDLIIIPSGDAVHAAKQLAEFDPDKGGQSLYRDKFHMHLTYGRYLLACVWYKTLLCKSPVGVNFLPDDIPDGETLNESLLPLLQKVANSTLA
ncbi:MAG: DUF4886 domain-containing protein [Clostridia bacterium]|nr:DUF4886 domain-containing protein [Clostridia bacterium]